MLKHFVVTRMGIGIHNESWFRSALGLFEGITLPSFRAQTSQDFTALIIVDSDMPKSARSRLDALLAESNNIHIVPIDLTAMQQVRQGCFDYVWEECQDYLLGRRLLVDPFEYVITSVIDGDDAWHRETVAYVQARMSAELPALRVAEQERVTWIRHTGGVCLSFPDGLKWFAHANVAEPMHYPFLSMSVFVLARFSSGISACSSRHSQWPSYCNVLGFKALSCEPGRPMWTYVRHDRTEVPWETGDDTPQSDLALLDRLHADFGIDLAKVAQWRAERELRVEPASAETIQHPGMAGTEQLDCYFRITALNRQIEILERNIVQSGGDIQSDELLARQRFARDALVAKFREQAQTLFR